MAFKIPASNGLHARRANERSLPSVRRATPTNIQFDMSNRVLRRMGVTADSLTHVDVFVGNGVDQGLVRIVAGSTFKVAKTNSGIRFAINPVTTEGFATGDVTMSEFVEITSHYVASKMITIRMPSNLLAPVPEAVAA